MKIITKEEFVHTKTDFAKAIKRGDVFIYPTDTIYGIGCNAKVSEAVGRLRRIKDQKERPLSVIVPSKEWIKENCDSPNRIEMRRWIKKLPGPYTLILKLRHKNAVCEETNLGSGTIGVRIPEHWIKDVASKLNIPIITTSANISGSDHMTNIDNLSRTVAEKVDFIIYEGERHGRASTIIDLSGEEVGVRKR